jgi:hypothetical protein
VIAENQDKATISENLTKLLNDQVNPLTVLFNEDDLSLRRH